MRESIYIHIYIIVSTRDGLGVCAKVCAGVCDRIVLAWRAAASSIELPRHPPFFTPGYAARYAPGNAAELFWRGEHGFDRTAEVGRPSLSTPRMTLEMMSKSSDNDPNIVQKVIEML